MARRESTFGIPLVATMLIHIGFAAGLHAAERFVKIHRRSSPMEVTFELKKAPPARPEVEPPPPPAPPPEAPKLAEPPRPKKKLVASKEVPKEPPPATETTPPPAPGTPTPDEEPAAAQRIYVLPGAGGMAVNPGAAGGKATGRPGGTGTGTGTGGSGGEPGGTGRVVPLASVKKMPEAIGDYDLSKDYPAEAKRLGVEGEVAVRMLVDVTGKVADTRLVRGPGHGLDEKAIQLARRIRFKPAIDDSNQPVATWITWTFTFRLPR